MSERPEIRDNPGYWIPTERLAPLVRKWLDDHSAQHNATGEAKLAWGHARKDEPRICSAGAQATLVFMSGVNARKIYSICRCEHKNTSLAIVDKLLTAMGLVHLFYLPPEAGGFADRYFHESIVGTEAMAA